MVAKMGLFDKLLGKQKDNKGNDDILAIIRKDASLAEKVGALCNIDIYPSLQPPFAQVKLSIPGMAFGKEGGGGEYVFLEDGSIGYVGAEGECGRVAETLRDVFELELNCAYSWYNYAERKYMDAPETLARDILKYEVEGREQFADAYGDDMPDYDALRNEIAKTLNLKISNDISTDILPSFFKSATREPLFFFTDDEGNRSYNLVR
ncbi:MAG: hypothetical protein LBH61_02760 [Dysgonamonadaceae bacterium]|jgi:hypothetical protein|nr:hypothetical protein [Dysgonamonadaceae bacterium]